MPTRKAHRRKRRSIIGRSDGKIGQERSFGCAFLLRLAG
jgi:hypothetical protein